HRPRERRPRLRLRGWRRECREHGRGPGQRCVDVSRRGWWWEWRRWWWMPTRELRHDEPATAASEPDEARDDRAARALDEGEAWSAPLQSLPACGRGDHREGGRRGRG